MAVIRIGLVDALSELLKLRVLHRRKVFADDASDVFHVETMLLHDCPRLVSQGSTPEAVTIIAKPALDLIKPVGAPQEQRQVVRTPV